MKKEVLVLITLLVLGSVTTMSAVAAPAECGENEIGPDGHCLTVPGDGGGFLEGCKKVGKFIWCCTFGMGGCEKQPEPWPGADECTQMCMDEEDRPACENACNNASDYCQDRCRGANNPTQCLQECNAEEPSCNNYCSGLTGAALDVCKDECMDGSDICKNFCEGKPADKKAECLIDCGSKEGGCHNICDNFGRNDRAKKACMNACLKEKKKCVDVCQNWQGLGYSSPQDCFNRAQSCQ